MEWIKCSDKLPEHHEECIINDKHIGVISASYSAGCKEFFDQDWSYGLDTVTHWMLMPPPPKENK